MPKAPTPREAFEKWLKTRAGLEPALSGMWCTHQTWIGNMATGLCGLPATWVLDYPAVGVRAHCERHAVDVISRWSSYERGVSA